MYVTILVCVAIMMTLFGLFTFILRKKVTKKHIVVTCIIVFVIEMLFFFIYPMPTFFFDKVRLKISEENNQKDVLVKSFFQYNTVGDFPEVVSGKWFWNEGRYGWQQKYSENLTDSVVFRVPVGRERTIVFCGHNNGGMVEVIFDDFNEKVNLYSAEPEDIGIKIPDSKDILIQKNEFLRILFFSFSNIALLCIIFVLTRFVLKYNVGKKICNYKYELFFSFISLFMIIRYGFYPGIGTHQATFYIKGYEFGFVKRGLIGAILTNISPYISQESFALFKLITLLFLFFALSWIVGFLLKKQDDEIFRWFLFLFILAMPSTFISIPDNLRLDIIAFIMFALSAFCITQKYLVLIVPILIFNMLLVTEQSCTFFLLPLLFMLLYKFIKCRETKYGIILVVSLFVGVIVCSAFIFGHNSWLNYESWQIISHLQQHTGFEINGGAVYGELYNLKEVVAYWIFGVSQYYKYYIMFLLMIMPAIILFGRLFISCYKLKVRENSRIINIVFRLLVLSPLSAFLIMAISVDWPRYIASMFDAFFVILFFILHEEKLKPQYSVLFPGSTGMNNLALWPIGICFFYLVFGCFNGDVLNVPTNVQFVNFFSALLGI